MNAHNACLACSSPVQELYSAAAVILQLLDRDGAFTVGALDDLRHAVATIRPYVEAHFGNHDHAMSPELASVRNPALLAPLVLDRGLPFAVTGDSDR